MGLALKRDLTAVEIALSAAACEAGWLVGLALSPLLPPPEAPRSMPTAHPDSVAAAIIATIAAAAHAFTPALRSTFTRTPVWRRW
jgi:hypothetical protein